MKYWIDCSLNYVWLFMWLGSHYVKVVSEVVAIGLQGKFVEAGLDQCSRLNCVNSSADSGLKAVRGRCLAVLVLAPLTDFTLAMFMALSFAKKKKSKPEGLFSFIQFVPSGGMQMSCPATSELQHCTHTGQVRILLKMVWLGCFRSQSWHYWPTCLLANEDNGGINWVTC